MGQQIPISAVSPDQLPAETPLKYDELCRVVGALYLDAHHRESTMKEHFLSIVQNYTQKIEELTLENGQLKKALADQAADVGH